MSVPFSPYNLLDLFFLFFFFFFFFLGLHTGIESELQLLAYITVTATWDLSCICDLHHRSELQLLAYTTAIAIWDPSCICDLHHRSWQCQILNPLSESRDWTCNLVVPSWICFHCTTMGTLPDLFFPDIFTVTFAFLI